MLQSSQPGWYLHPLLTPFPLGWVVDPSCWPYWYHREFSLWIKIWYYISEMSFYYPPSPALSTMNLTLVQASVLPNLPLIYAFPHPCTHFVFASQKPYHVSFLYGSLFDPPPSIHHEAQTVTQAMITCLSLTDCLIVQAELPVLQECQAPAVIHRANFKSSFKVLPVRFLFWSFALVSHLWWSCPSVDASVIFLPHC